MIIIEVKILNTNDIVSTRVYIVRSMLKKKVYTIVYKSGANVIAKNSTNLNVSPIKISIPKVG